MLLKSEFCQSKDGEWDGGWGRHRMMGERGNWDWSAK